MFLFSAQLQKMSEIKNIAELYIYIIEWMYTLIDEPNIKFFISNWLA